MVDALGWINLFLVLLMGSIYPLKRAATAKLHRVGKEKARGSMEVYQKMRIIHPVLGAFIIGIGLVHGYLALGTLRLHTGLLVVMWLMLMGGVAIFGPKMKVLRKKWRNLHRGMGLVLLILVIIHLSFGVLLRLPLLKVGDQALHPRSKFGYNSVGVKTPLN